VTETQTTAERVARNDAIFRDANEGIRNAAHQYAVAEAVPFICECAAATCTEIVRLQLREYEAVRASPTCFINAPGHHSADQGWAEVVEHRDGYDLVRKIGRAASMAEALDPRRTDGRA
jgi:hypothetical protein